MQEKFKEIDLSGLLKQEQEGGGQEVDYGLGIRKIQYETEVEETYAVQVRIGRRLYTRNYTLPQITRRKFLQEFGIEIEDEPQFYRKFRRQILQMEFSGEYISYETARNGLQRVAGRWMYVFGNGSIDASGFRPDVKSRIGGIYFPPDKVYERESCISDICKLFHVFHVNPSIFYPMFLINIMGITNGYLRKIGEDSFMRLTLWLDGASGSGKTEIAKAGTYAFGDKEFDRKAIVSVTGKRKDVLMMLLQSSGGVGIVDDVKQEAVRERRNGVKNNVDDCIRSIFQGYLTDSVSGQSGDKKIDCCAVITGEYLDTCESQNARMIYIRADGFLKNKKNAEALRFLQEQPKLLAGVCGGYIRFLLRKMEESSFQKLIKVKLREARSGIKMYQGINNAERLHENRCMLEIAAWMAAEYFRDIDMKDAFISEFCQDADKGINEAMDATFYLLGGGQMLFLKAMERILQKSRVRKAYYKETFARASKWQYRQEYFCINKDYDDFLWIEDYKKSMRKERQENHCGYGENPVLIIRKERLEELFQKEIHALLKEKEAVSSENAEKVICQFWKMLREMQMIYQIPRSDSKMGRPAAEYPVFKHFTEQSVYGEASIYVMKFESVVQMNIAHPCAEKLVERMEGVEAKNIFEGTNYLKIENEEGMRIQEEDVYEKRQKFVRGKSLYKR